MFCFRTLRCWRNAVVPCGQQRQTLIPGGITTLCRRFAHNKQHRYNRRYLARLSIAGPLGPSSVSCCSSPPTNKLRRTWQTVGFRRLGRAPAFCHSAIYHCLPCAVSCTVAMLRDAIKLSRCTVIYISFRQNAGAGVRYRRMPPFSYRTQVHWAFSQRCCAAMRFCHMHTFAAPYR